MLWGQALEMSESGSFLHVGSAPGTAPSAPPDSLSRASLPVTGTGFPSEGARASLWFIHPREPTRLWRPAELRLTAWRRRRGAPTGRSGSA